MTHYLETEGGKLAYDFGGPNDGPLVICGHALGDTRASYRPLVDHLISLGYAVATFDNRGHGESSAAFDRYGDEAIADDFINLAQKLGASEARRIVLAGASMAGAGAVIAAARQPSIIAGIILIGAFLRNPSMYGVVRPLMSVATLQPWGPPLMRSYFATLWPGLGKGAAERAQRAIELATRPGYWAALRASLAGTDHSVVAPWLKKFDQSIPVYVVIGTVDPDWKDAPAEAAWVAEQFTGAEVLEVEGAGHAPMLERPETVNPGVAQFLTKVKGSGRW
jgi:pimeloyl-ACP methyl ester carboxylesterase